MSNCSHRWLTACAVCALTTPAFAGSLDLDSRTAAAMVLASDFSGPDLGGWVSPAGLGSFMIDDDATTPSMLTATIASMVFSYVPGSSISGGAAIDGFTFVPGGHTEGAVVFDVFFTVTSPVAYTWDYFTFMADPITTAVIELSGPGGLIAIGAGVFAPGEYHIMGLLEMDSDPPPGPAGFSTHFVYDLTFPTPGAAALFGIGAIAAGRRRR